MDRVYYSQRIGRSPLANPSMNDVARVLTLTVDEMWQRGYMQEWHGYYCISAGNVGGRAAASLPAHIEAETGWRSAWPLSDPLFDLDDPPQSADLDWDQMAQLLEDMLFDLIEYFHRHVSQGIEEDKGSHLHNRCGWHYGAFDPGPAQALFRSRMNRTLTNYVVGGGFRISENGQVEHTADDGLDQLIDAPLPTKDPDVAQRVAGAIALYRNRGRTEQDLRFAVRELFDALGTC